MTRGMPRSRCSSEVTEPLVSRAGAGSVEYGEWNIDDAAGNVFLALDAVIVKARDPVLYLVFRGSKGVG